MAVSRVTSQDIGYSVGDLSVYPSALDSRYQLYEATNNSETVLGNDISSTGSALNIFRDSDIKEIRSSSVFVITILSASLII